MNRQELTKRFLELEREDKLRLVVKRHCIDADIIGVRRIIKENKTISCMSFRSVNPIDHFDGCMEYFYTTDDEEFNKWGREEILKV